MKKHVVLAVILCSLYVFFSGFHNSRSNESELYRELSLIDFGPFDQEKILYVNIGIDYVPYELIELFEDLTGVRVIVDIFDSNEILEAKLLAGGAKYDLVFPTAWPNFSRQLKAGIYQKIDKTKVDRNMFDADILARLAENDGENDYAVPYQFGISGIGMEESLVDRLVPNAPKDSLAIIFDPVYAEKISKYRISLYESPCELFPAVLAYLGLNPETEKEEDIRAASEHLKKIRRYISKFTAYGFEDIASGNACVTLSTSGDIIKIRSDNKKPHVKFFLPKEGASLWVDVIAIPKGARHLKNSYAFMGFLFHPKIIAQVTNKTSRANAVTASAQFVSSDLTNDTNIYPSADIRKKCYIEKTLDPKIESLKTRLLTKIKSMGTGL
ncbi:MAG: extracellular solute-binding protein [Holosporaceae bacterium]|jgi:putrescine transport system substrate-binding protein|nr:extracellular solute-binding protein [Holosporaceae bacterium]